MDKKLEKPAKEPDPAQDTILRKLGDGPVVRGSRGDNYLCWNCGAILLETISTETVRNVYFPCFNCKAMNYKGDA